MIDELPTRAAMTAAAFLVLATGLSVLSAFGGDAVRDAAVDLAGHLARSLDEVGVSEGTATYRGGVGAAGAFDMPQTLAGSTYSVAFGATSVRVTAGGAVAVASLRTAVHPFAPDRPSYSAAGLQRGDLAVLAVAGGQPFVVERAERTVDGVPVLLTFLYLP